MLLENKKSLKEWAIMILGLAFSGYFIYTARFGVISPQLNRGLYIGFTTVLVILLFPGHKDSKIMRAFDIFLLLLSAAGIVYFIKEYPNMSARIGRTTVLDLIFGTIIIGVSLEVTRRKNGMPLMFIALFFLLYNFFGPFIPGLFGHPGFSYGRVVSFLFTSLFGVFGSVTQIFASYVFLFIVFSAFMEKSGAAKFFIDLPYALTGRSRGGPAKAAVIASGLMGSVSGSAVANVMTTGTFTIPLMKKTGYKAHVAAAIETAASSGGQLIPPIMGAGAFVMAELTGIAYKTIVLVSIFPALLYFFSVLLMTDLAAAKTGLKGLPKKDLPDPLKTFKKGWFYLIPLIILITVLVSGRSPSYAAFWAIVANIAVSWLNPESRMGVKEILEAMKDAAVKSLTVGATAGSIGIIIGTVYLTGLGLKFSNIILSLSNGWIPLSIILVAIASYVLGMGLTVTSSYIILAVLAAPALESLGLDPLAAHLIIFWLSQDANVTPPVCLAAFAAAGIAEASPVKTGWTAIKYAKAIYVVPFLIAYTPILMTGTIVENILIIINSLIGMTLFSLFAQGYFFVDRIKVFERILLAGTALLFFIPVVKFNLIGVGILGAYLIFFILRYRKKTHASDCELLETQVSLKK